MNNVLVGMSGGVDSTICTKLLLDQGYDVSGVTLIMHNYSDHANDIESAKESALALNIPHNIINCVNEFKENVVIPFGESYKNCETPNPCVTCNRFVKFPILLKIADEKDCQYIATGHYVKKDYNEKSNRFFLRKADDIKKDQTYFLYGLSQDILKRCIFPMGDIIKSDAKIKAKDLNLSVANRPESQDICFINNEYEDFLIDKLGFKYEPGDFINSNNKILGKHKGIPFYTIGQRRGLGISADERLFVIDKNKETNIVTLGYSNQLLSKRVIVKNINWMAIDTPKKDFFANVKLRYSINESKAKIIPIDNNKAILEFDDFQRAPAVGQSAVFYENDILLGGGIIEDGGLL